MPHYPVFIQKIMDEGRTVILSDGRKQAPKNWRGAGKIGHITCWYYHIAIVEHRKRKYGVTKFGWDRFVNGFLDLATITFVGKFGKRPMHFFGLWGTIFFLVGFIISGYLIVSKIVDSNFSITNRPTFFIALVSMVIGSQLFLAGFIGELIGRNSPERNNYLIEDKAGL